MSSVLILCGHSKGTIIRSNKFCGQVQIAALTILGSIDFPEHATEMTHSRVKTTLKFLQCRVPVEHAGSNPVQGSSVFFTVRGQSLIKSFRFDSHVSSNKQLI